MPTVYPPLLNHEPASVEELEAIDEFLSSRSKQIWEHFRKHGISFEEDDLEALLSSLGQVLVKFILTSKALPLRSPNQLAATVKKIANDPDEFIADMNRYDPEATAKVLAVLCRNRETQHQLLRFEGGLGRSPPAEVVGNAAKVVLKEIAHQNAGAKVGQRRGGRPSDTLQEDLAIELAGVYGGFGGSIARRVHDTEYGPFHEFLGIVLPAVQKHGIEAKSSLTITSMVRAAQEERAY
jgi:hypothetical protein